MTAPSLVQQFLADRDAPCPGCGYNLRGIGGDACPECSRPVVLSVQDGSPSLWSRRLLVLALWTLLVWGGLSAVSSLLNIYRFSMLGAGSLPTVFLIQALASILLHLAQGGLAVMGLIRWRRGVRGGQEAAAFAFCTRVILLIVIGDGALVAAGYALWMAAAMFFGF